MSRPAQFTPEEIKVRRNARRVEYQRRKMAEDPAYREKQKAMWRDWYSRNKDVVKGHVKKYREETHPTRHLLQNVRNNAKRRGHEFSLEYEDVVWPTHCPALGIELNYRNKRGGPRNDSPSVDRIDNSKGYVKGNVIVVSQLANRIKTSATPAQVLRVAKFYAKLTNDSPTLDQIKEPS